MYRAMTIRSRRTCRGPLWFNGNNDRRRVFRHLLKEGVHEGLERRNRYLSGSFLARLPQPHPCLLTYNTPEKTALMAHALIQSTVHNVLSSSSSDGSGGSSAA